MASKILHVLASDENTPLLIAEPALTPGPEAEIQTANNGLNGQKSHVNDEGEDDGEDEDKPLPKLQIALLCFARLIEPMAFFGIFPFVNKMIQETGGLKEEDVGFYSGLINCKDDAYRE
ncbi:hypothetical protein M7I_2762 [Glarea lozoyensis 74030]|uniref:Uncharacterized protein n=1 Tax=Glarea lozoyensis (strain ATCC 74030 / MF5533) TaxID=1104152 RepID=H0EJN3_GLAL7|nr:hypothetical protein M7I_2762 [Glarea lozoyensis 74030]